MKRLLSIFFALFLAITAHAAEFAAKFNTLKRLAEEGNPVSQFELGVIYATGKDTPINDKEAIKWLRRSATKGHAEAQLYLGAMYYFGFGVTQNYKDAYVWASIASSNGISRSENMLNKLSENMSKELIEKAQEQAKACLTSTYRDCP